ncbi:MAG: hypothetical protein ACYC4U_32045, partial [Pirellulaceae bacterium]
GIAIRSPRPTAVCATAATARGNRHTFSAADRGLRERGYGSARPRLRRGCVAQPDNRSCERPNAPKPGRANTFADHGRRGFAGPAIDHEEAGLPQNIRLGDAAGGQQA